jgi:serine phosphatase RsbU (regulator of sigma subunit)
LNQATFDLLDTANLILWLLPLPFLGLALTGRGRAWWPGWIQVGTLIGLAALEIASQVGPTTGPFSWVAARERLWNFLGGAGLMIAIAEGSAWFGPRGTSRRAVQMRRFLSTGFAVAGLAAAVLWSPARIGAASLLPWIALVLFEGLAVATAPVVWVGVLRAIAAFSLGASLLFPQWWIAFTCLGAILAATQALAKIRHDAGVRIARAREALQPKAIQELLASTTGPHASPGDESLPVERLEALLVFAMRSTGSIGGAVFLFQESIVPEIGTLARRLACLVAKGSLKDLPAAPGADLAAQALLSLVSGSEHASEVSPEGAVESYLLDVFHSPRLAVAVVRSEGRPLGMVVLAPAADREHFSPGDLHVLEFLAQQALSSLRYEAVFHRLQEDSRLSREFEIASRIQKGLLPRSTPQVPGLEMSARVLPAREVGGDYYDLLPLPDDRLLAVIGDVSGKGLPAGMIMLIVRTTLHLLVDAEPHASPARLVKALEERLVPQLDAFTFMTFLALRWSPRDRLMTWSGAGHEHILWLSTVDGKLHRIRTGGLALGLQRENFAMREERRLLLAPGDVVLLYTDGVTDCRDPHGAAWGLDGLEASLDRHRELAPDDLLEAVLADLDRFRGSTPPPDDRTLVVFRAS